MDVATSYRLHGAMVLRRARRMLRDHAAAQDVVHDVFLLMHQRQAEVRKDAVVSWLYVVTTNLCLRRMRSTTTRARLNLTIPVAASAPARGDALVEVRSLLAQLPDELAAAAIYRFVDEMTHAEIAELMGCSRRHVGDLLVRLATAMESQRRLA